MGAHHAILRIKGPFRPNLILSSRTTTFINSTLTFEVNSAIRLVCHVALNCRVAQVARLLLGRLIIIMSSPTLNQYDSKLLIIATVTTSLVIVSLLAPATSGAIAGTSYS